VHVRPLRLALHQASRGAQNLEQSRLQRQEEAAQLLHPLSDAHRVFAEGEHLAEPVVVFSGFGTENKVPNLSQALRLRRRNSHRILH